MHRRHARRREPFGFRSRSCGALDFGRRGRDRGARRGAGGRRDDGERAC